MKIETVEDLHALYEGNPSEAALKKVATSLTPMYRKWIMASRFCVLSTVGPEGTDGSPRGDIGPLVQEIDSSTLVMPDWRGNNRLDSLRNIVRDGRISLMFMVPRSATIVRLNGQAEIRMDGDLTARFQVKGQHPKSVILVKINEIYTQCARAILRSQLWTSDDQSNDLPSPGDILTEMTSGDIDGAAYDTNWPKRAAKTMW